MPKYWGKQIFTHGRFPEVGQNQKTERERLNDGNNNGARKPPGPIKKIFTYYNESCNLWEFVYS